MNDRLSALRLFVRVAHRRSFSAGGRDLQVPQPTVSRLIAHLEREIGAVLFTRTTRAVTLTEAGADFLTRVEPVLAALDEAEHAARGTRDLRGVLRVAVTAGFCSREVTPRLSVFMDRHPELKVELLISDVREELVTEGVDVALRFGELADSTATARRIGAWPRLVAASPSYLARFGVPAAPADLAAHAVILGPSPAGRTWIFQRGEMQVSVRVDGRLTVSTMEAATAAAVAGLGVLGSSEGGCRHELKQGTLVQVLADWNMGTIELHAVFPAGRAVRPAARAFAQHLAETCAD